MWVLSAPTDKCQPANDVLASFGVSGSWQAQPVSPFSYQLRTQSRIAHSSVPDLVSKLASLDVPFEVETEGAAPERYLFHPGLGICRQVLNEAGEVLVRGEAIESALLASKGNLKEFERRLRLIQGFPWLDLLEVYRSPSDVRLLHRAI